ncbi:hypothetical protein [Myxococcus sp. SDU36]|uniref:hypothetical protein n=1 Tax=Myxococcus sp. SDU36 TaxID=2831967 RepID=UPI002543E6CB|nr:hypothetical protein [Myxococcus sp. SDU36]WIG92948.1 hypothetical protein KGD87_20175 [Myxococcus sp. SDU36]
MEGQGEAIECQADGAGYFTMSESPVPTRLKRVARQSPVEGALAWCGQGPLSARY